MEQDRVVLVTGASRGIGRATALELARRGDIVVGTATSDNGAAAITQALADHGGRGLGVVLDVNDEAACKATLEMIGEKFAPPAVLVNNAGVTRDNLAMRMKDEEWEAVIDTNLKSVFRLTRLAMRAMMKARFGRIINITSLVGHAGNAGQANYCAAKAGVAGMTRALAQELGSRNVTVNCVAPGLIATDMTRELPEAQKSAMLAAIPVNRIGLPEDVAHAVAFLSDERSGFITGVTLHVNGGMYMQ